MLEVDAELLQVYQHVTSQAFQMGILPWHCNSVGSPCKISDHTLAVPLN